MSLYLFTSSFPFGFGEGFLDDELAVLAQSFDDITIYPMVYRNANQRRTVPENVRVMPPLMSVRTRGNLKGLFNRASFGPYMSDFIRHRVFLNRKKLRSWIREYLHINAVLNSQEVSHLKSVICDDDIIYTYWGRDAYALSYFWTGKCKFVSRFHGSTDLWENDSDGYKPLRDKILRNLDLAISVSQKGKDFLDSKYPGGKTVVGRLGNSDHGVSQKSDDGVIRVLSCSNVLPLKRVDLIFKALSIIKDRKIEWVHIGSGPSAEELKCLVNESPQDNLSVQLIGQLSHDDVLNYYREHAVDVFVNVSKIEGVPVSIMEAISFDVPVVATDVGATSEIVNNRTGILLCADPSIMEVSSAILSVLEMDLNPRSFWSEKYDSAVNYVQFVSLLKAL